MASRPFRTHAPSFSLKTPPPLLFADRRSALSDRLTIVAKSANREGDIAEATVGWNITNKKLTGYERQATAFRDKGQGSMASTNAEHAIGRCGRALLGHRLAPTETANPKKRRYAPLRGAGWSIFTSWLFDFLTSFLKKWSKIKKSSKIKLK